jgi:hypothetical protein
VQELQQQQQQQCLNSPVVLWKPLSATRCPPVLFAADVAMLPGALALPTEMDRPVLVLSFMYPMHLQPPTITQQLLKIWLT